MPFPGFEDTINKIKAFDFGHELQEIVGSNLDKLPPYIKEQLAAGKDGDGEPTRIFDRDTYSPKTIEIKKAEGQGLGVVTDRITNYMTGDFYNSLREEIEGQVFAADSDVSYFGDIRLRSSESLLNINEKNRLDFATTVTLPAIKEALFTKTGLAITTR